MWSPDSDKIAYSDKRLNLWYVDLAHPAPVKVDTDMFDTPLHDFSPAWSPDGKWLAYTKQLPNHLRAVFVYSLAGHKATQVTDGMSDCLYPSFDKNGKYLYFTASTDMGLSTGWLDMTSEAHPVTRSVYVAVLRKNLPSPIAPESDEDKGVQAAAVDGEKDKGKDKGKDKDDAKSADHAVDVTIDFDGILQRTLALPIPPANYIGMAAGKSWRVVPAASSTGHRRRRRTEHLAEIHAQAAQGRQAGRGCDEVRVVLRWQQISLCAKG